MLDTATARRVRRTGLTILVLLLVALWISPRVSLGAQVAASAYLGFELLRISGRLATMLYRTRKARGFFWREHHRDLAAFPIVFLIRAGALAALWGFPSGSVASRAAQSAVLVLFMIESPIWTIAITEEIWDRRRPQHSLPDPLSEAAVVEMRDQDGVRVAFPEARDAKEWYDVMRPGDTLTFLTIDGAELLLSRASEGTTALRHVPADGSPPYETSSLHADQLRCIVLRFLEDPVDARSLMNGDAPHANWERLPPYVLPPVIAVSFGGILPPGSEGNRFAKAMADFLSAALSATNAAGVVIDLTGLSYEWGDGIGGLAMPFLGSGRAAAIVATGATAEALRPLTAPPFLLGVAGIAIFAAREEAQAHVRRS